MKPIRRLFYFGLEPLAARYTKQLCEDWFPKAVAAVSPSTLFVKIEGCQVEAQITVGAVLDATGRGMYACRQVENFMREIRSGSVSNDDAIFLQDFWTPGFEAVPYALHLYGLTGVKIYSMLHAQSVDEYDFTWGMRHWMRPMEVGLSRVHTAVFVGSTIHRDQLRVAGFECPIHVVGLPISVSAVEAQMPAMLSQRERKVVFTSRLDREKNPRFMLEVARLFLLRYKDWTWCVTTSAADFRSNEPETLKEIVEFAQDEPRFKLLSGLTKEQYYNELATAAIQFNCSLQDYVSWTLLEACIAGCNLVYPHFRSFPEILPAQNMYQAFDMRSVLRLLSEKVQCRCLGFRSIAMQCDAGRVLEAEIVCGLRNPDNEVNIWHAQI